MKKIISIILTIVTGFAFLNPAYADNLAVDFEPSTYTIGNIDGQDGWSKTGPFDSEVVANNFGFPSFDAQSLRISNAVTSGSFGDQTFAKPLTDSVGEADATSGTFDEGTKQNRFEMQFDIASTQSTQQTGLALSVSPDRGDGSRMSYLAFTDTTGGIDVTFYDVQGTTNPANFVPTVIATDLDRTAPHTVKLVMDVIDGPSNDVVKVYINGTLVHTGTSWENYYRYDSEASAEQSPRIIKTVLFRAAGTAAPETSGDGFLFDNLTLNSSTPVEIQPTGEITNPATDGETVSGDVNFTATYDDGDEANDDGVQWAIRQGSCSTNTVFGNVDGRSDTYEWDGASFSATTDTSEWTPGEYCFVFNPVDDPGQDNVRLTRTFTVEEVEEPVVGPPTSKDQCKNGGWEDFNNPSFRNQGQCIKYVNGNNGNNSNTSSSTVRVNQRNTSTVSNNVTVTQNTGGNKANRNTGNTTVTTGNNSSIIEVITRAARNIFIFR